jgi:hypothetical protein
MYYHLLFKSLFIRIRFFIIKPFYCQTLTYELRVGMPEKEKRIMLV